MSVFSGMSMILCHQRKIAAIGIVTLGYGRDMDEEMANALFYDIDFHHNKAKSRICLS